ncbi:polyamine transporter 1 [Sesbania bispinosa]|nr:polyamine transporter 1 [Sesbania bispinosa]
MVFLPSCGDMPFLPSPSDMLYDHHANVVKFDFHRLKKLILPLRETRLPRPRCPEPHALWLCQKTHDSALELRLCRHRKIRSPLPQETAFPLRQTRPLCPCSLTTCVLAMFENPWPCSATASVLSPSLSTGDENY